MLIVFSQKIIGLLLKMCTTILDAQKDPKQSKTWLLPLERSEMVWDGMKREFEFTLETLSPLTGVGGTG